MRLKFFLLPLLLAAAAAWGAPATGDDIPPDIATRIRATLHERIPELQVKGLHPASVVSGLRPGRADRPHHVTGALTPPVLPANCLLRPKASPRTPAPGRRQRAPERLLGGHNGLASGRPDCWWRRHGSEPIRRSGTRRLAARSYAR